MVKVDFNRQKTKDATRRVMGVAIQNMARDVKDISKISVPFKDGDLQKSVEIQSTSGIGKRVVYDKEYAGYQEYGQRKDGTRKVRNYTTANTDKHYLQGAGEKVSKNALNYLKQANSILSL